MRVFDILNLNLRKLNHHEEVYSQEAISGGRNGRGGHQVGPGTLPRPGAQARIARYIRSKNRCQALLQFELPIGVDRFSFPPSLPFCVCVVPNPQSGAGNRIAQRTDLCPDGKVGGIGLGPVIGLARLVRVDEREPRELVGHGVASA